MKHRSNILSLFPAVLGGLIFVLVAGGGMSGAAPLYFQQGCNSNWLNQNPQTRNTARDYAYGAVYEGYQWGGGCWNYDNYDSAPNDPPQQYTGGEGGDCSGFTFKSWWERSETDDAGWRYHYALQNVHGPYNSQAFKDGVGAPNTVISKPSTVYMDALASSPHIGMIYYANTAYNEDRIIEAKCETCGTFTWPRTYRGDPAYGGVRRTGWAG
jgi:hypothetical protein